MGLDMYVQAKKYLSEYREDDKEVVKQIGGVKALQIPFGARPKIIEAEVMYWRKANAIHAWFVDNVQDGEDNCQEYDVGLEDFKALADVCLQVMNDPQKAPELLPVQQGFFFGTYEYDEWYMEYVKQTYEFAKKVVDEYDTHAKNGWWFVYHSSW